MLHRNAVSIYVSHMITMTTYLSHRINMVSYVSHNFIPPPPPPPRKRSFGGLSVCSSLSVQSKLNLGYNFWTKRYKAYICGSLWQDLSVGTKNCDLVTLTLTFDLLLKKNDLTLAITERAFILQMCIPHGKNFLLVPKFLTHDLGFNFWPNFEKLKIPNHNYFITGLQKLGRGY